MNQRVHKLYMLLARMRKQQLCLYTQWSSIIHPWYMDWLVCFDSGHMLLQSQLTINLILTHIKTDVGE